MKLGNNSRGFTLVEILVVIVVVVVLALLGVVGFNGIQKRAAEALVFKDLASAAEQVDIAHARTGGHLSEITELPTDFIASEEVVVRLASGYSGPFYSDLSNVQNGVLLYDVCVELIADPVYSIIHAREGGGSQAVVMRCTDNINAGSLLITGWDSRTWSVPLERGTIQDYINSVPYDDWWIDRQDVVRGFYYELMNRFELRGGTFPVESFWDPWANQWSGVPKEELPPPSQSPATAAGSYCIEGYHSRYSDDIYYITETGKIETGGC